MAKTKVSLSGSAESSGTESVVEVEFHPTSEHEWRVLENDERGGDCSSKLVGFIEALKDGVFIIRLEQPRGRFKVLSVADAVTYFRSARGTLGECIELKRV